MALRHQIKKRLLWEETKKGGIPPIRHHVTPEYLPPDPRHTGIRTVSLGIRYRGDTVVHDLRHLLIIKHSDVVLLLDRGLHNERG
jgi:hypothetical protein